MKRIQWNMLLLAMVLLLTLTACGGSMSAGTPSGESTSIEGEQSSQEQVKTNEEQGSTLLTGTYKVPGKEIYADTPNYPEYSDGFTRTFAIYDSRYVAITYGKRIQAADAKEAQVKVWGQFAPSMGGYGGGINSIDIQKDELITINGMETYCFEGTIKYGFSTFYEGYVKGYSFVIDGMPCHIIGSVYSEEQTQDEIDEIRAIVDAMIYTVRTEP